METTITGFQVGRCYLTTGAQFALQEAGQLPYSFLDRHSQCDWGEVCKDDWTANDEAVTAGERVLSAYTTRKGDRIWIITEAGFKTTTILLPAEY